MSRRLGAAVAAVAALGLLPIGDTPSRAAGSVLSTYGGDASATSVHVLSATNALTNFRTGFVDNSLPLASAHLDAAPASQGTATVVDTGPAGGLVVSQAPTVIQQPQYAVARFPGSPTASVNEGPSVAEAKADETSAQAHGALAAVGADSGTDEATSRVSVDRTSGTIDVSSVGHVSSATFATGVLVIAGLDVRASVTATGSKVTPRYEISLASATVGGTPVAITDKGVVAADPVPGSDAVSQAVNAQLNQALAGSGLEVFMTAPVVKVLGTQATVEVSGVHVRYTAPAIDPSVPSLTVEYILGEARAFGFAVAGSASDESTPSPPPSVDAASTTLDVGSVSGPIASLTPEQGVGGLAAGAAPRSRAVTALPASFRRARPTWLVPIYLIWQALMLATAGVLVWSRGDHSG